MSDISEESAKPEKREEKGEKKKAEVVTFARPPLAKEVFTKENQGKFDELPGWARHLFKRFLQHGDLGLAAKESNVEKQVRGIIDLKKAEVYSIEQALTNGGITADFLVEKLKTCIEAEGISFDKHKNVVRFTDLKVRLAAINVAAQLLGLYERGGKKDKDNTKSLTQLFKDTPSE